MPPKVRRLLLLLPFLWIACLPAAARKGQSDFVEVHEGQLWWHGKVYRFVGANLWYGAILGSRGTGGNRTRLCRELDLLHALGVNNLRILVGGEGNTIDSTHIQPTLQPQAGTYDENLLEGLDFLMAELEQRRMHAVLYLHNSWDWSGGYATYLQWAGDDDNHGREGFTGAVDAPAVDEWTAFQQHHSRFLHNDSARALAAAHTRHIVSRINTITGKPYAQSPALMAWEICNEPRAFARDSVTKERFVQWIDEQAQIIKALDPNHLVTTGSEGLYGCEVDIDLFERIHALPAIDYATAHVWPFNWAWLGTFCSTTAEALQRNGADSPQQLLTQAIAHTRNYVEHHREAMLRLHKPLVLEEFGYPRDRYALSTDSSTTARDTYFAEVFSLVAQTPWLAGCNFWAWGGTARVPHPHWQPGDPYTGDPAQEEQGLNSVFLTDTTTLNVIRQYALP